MQTIRRKESRRENIMKRFFSLILIVVIVLCVIIPSQADTVVYNQKIINELSSVCFLQLNDGGMSIKKIIAKLVDNGYLKKGYKSPVFSEEMQQAVIKFQGDHDLKCTGVMDNETLTLLLHNRKESNNLSLVFIPTDGGKKYHGNPYCSGMTYPRIVTVENALALGYTQCHSSFYNCQVLFKYYSSDGKVIDEEKVDDYIEYFIKKLQSYLKERKIPSTESNDQELKTDDNLDDEDIIICTIPTIPSALITRESDPAPEYIGNKNSHVFHKPSCTSVSDMKKSNQVQFNSREEAIAAVATHKDN